MSKRNTKIDPKNLADRLSRYRLQNHLTWPELARLLDMKLTTLYKLVKGYTNRPHETTLWMAEQNLNRIQKRGGAVDAGSQSDQ